MEQNDNSIAWEALEHNHDIKSGDWFWALAIITIAAAGAALFFGNFLLTLLILLGGGITAFVANREPKTISYAVNARCIKVGTTIYPFNTLESYHIDEDRNDDPLLLIKSERFFMPLILMPLPEEAVDDIEALLRGRLKEEFLEEPFSNKILEFFGF